MLSVHAVLDGLDVAFEAPVGITVLYGPSGAGKSRTLGCIAGSVTPSRGRIALDDDLWFDGRRSRAMHLRRVAYVFQSLALFPHLTALENVAYGVSRALPAAARRDHARAMLARMRVDGLHDRLPRTLSGGEAQRVALARAFAMEPRVVLLDEPFSALDRALKEELLGEVATRIEEAKVPALLVTHQPDDARLLGRRVVFLERGRVVRTGGVDDL